MTLAVHLKDFGTLQHLIGNGNGLLRGERGRVIFDDRVWSRQDPQPRPLAEHHRAQAQHSQKTLPSLDQQILPPEQWRIVNGLWALALGFSVMQCCSRGTVEISHVT